MNHSEIEIKFDEPYNKWADKIIEGLENHNIIYDTMMINRIQKSIVNKANSYLINIGYKPKDHLSYRVNLVSRIKREGLKFSIKSNKLLWKYLEYFLDLEDYKDCFDIEIIVDNYDKAIKDTIFISVKQDHINLAKDALIKSNNYKINKENLDILKKLNTLQKDKKIDLILKILENLIEEED